MAIKIFIVLIINLVLLTKSRAQDYYNLAKTSLQQENISLANEYAKKSWHRKPTINTAYMLAYANFRLDNIDTAAFYAGIALYDDTILKDVILNPSKKQQLNFILDTYKKHNIRRTQDLVKALYQGYPRLNLIRARLTLSNQVELTDKDVLRIKQLNAEEKKMPTWEQYIDSLRKSYVPDSVIIQLENERLFDEMKNHYPRGPEGANMMINDLLGVAENIFEIEWIDSSVYNKPSGYFDPYSIDAPEVNLNPYTQRRYYDSYYYPELYKKKEFLIYPMGVLYMNYMKTGVDTNNVYVVKYKLTKKNIEAFYNTIFPTIIEHKHTLKDFLKHYEF